MGFIVDLPSIAFRENYFAVNIQSGEWGIT